MGGIRDAALILLLPCRTGLRKINLASVLIGNGFTDPLLQYASYAPMLCTNATGHGPLISERECTKLKAALPRCEALVKACYGESALRLGTFEERRTRSDSLRGRIAGDERDSGLCVAAYVYCEAKLTSAYIKTGRSTYDITKFGDYAENDWIEEWLNQCVPSSSPPERLDAD